MHLETATGQCASLMCIVVELAGGWFAINRATPSNLVIVFIYRELCFNCILYISETAMLRSLLKAGCRRRTEVQEARWEPELNIQLIHNSWSKLDGVGPVDNRPSTTL